MTWYPSFISLFVDAGLKWSNDQCQRYAASLSYYTVFSLAPLLVIIVAIVGLVYGGSARTEIIAQVNHLVGPQIANIVGELIVSAARPFQSIFASLIALITFFIGATSVLVELRYTLNTIFGFAQPAEKHPTLWSQILRLILARLFSLLVIVFMGFAIIAMFFASTYFSILNAWIAQNTPGAFRISRVLDPLFTITAMTVLFAIVMTWLPAHRPPRRYILPGALVAAILFHIGKALMSFYLAHAAAASVYGAASSVVLLMLWVFFSTAIFLYGAQIAATLWQRALAKTDFSSAQSPDEL